MRLAAVSVDLDEIPNYFAIWGLDPAGSEHTVYDRALSRMLDWARHLSIPLTLFAVGSDLGRSANAGTLRGAHSAGHEIANHSYSHKYDLVRREFPEIVDEIERGARAIKDAVGEAPVGFRAPGYTVSDPLFLALRELGVEYDSSVFPCPAYYATKAAAISTMTLRGRASHSILDTPNMLRAPTRPYRIGAPYWLKGDGLVELPIQVTRYARLPYIGTSLTLAGQRGARWLTRMCVGEPLVNLELHGIDWLDTADGLDALAPYQPDVRVSLGNKFEALTAAVEELKKAGYAFVTLRETAVHFG